MASTASRRKVAEETYAALRRLMGLLHGRMRTGVARGQITLPQMFLLRYLAERRTATPKELAAKFGVTPGNVTGLVNKLEGAGLVTRTRTRADRRVVELRPTAKAVRRLRAAHAAAVESLLDAFQNWSTEEIVRLKTMLDRLLAARVEQTAPSRKRTRAPRS
ncbi:MAG TPA: MarR family transcriptional regulator [Thermoplasmata archaeon]|nr:MarR family transcriptional regulator [Thermoplasmata archaeon]